MLLITIPAIYRSTFFWFERNFSFITAVRASNFVHFPWATKISVLKSHLFFHLILLVIHKDLLEVESFCILTLSDAITVYKGMLFSKDLYLMTFIMFKMNAITAKEMSSVDELMINYYGISLVQMMENAGLSLAMLASKIIKYKKNKKIVVLVGKGNNGGGSLVAARHLHNFGYKVEVISSNKSLKKIPLRQLKILKKMKVSIYNYNNKKIEKIINGSDLIVDGLLGYNSKGNPYGAIKDLIEIANNSKKKILSLDIPSGLDPDTGKTYNPCIKANYTLTLAYPKKGLLAKKSKKYTGKLYLSYLTIPRELSRKLKLKINQDFSQYLFAYP